MLGALLVVMAGGLVQPADRMRQAAAQYEAFDYPGAAATYDSIARDPSAPADVRLDAAENAAKLHAALGERNAVEAATTLALKLKPTAARRAELDYVLPRFDWEAWAHHGDDEKLRARAVASLEAYFSAHGHDPDSPKNALEAAWRMTKLTNANRDLWLRRTVAAWNALHAQSQETSLRAPFVDYGAEADFTQIDQSIRPQALKFNCKPGYYRLAVSYADTVDAQLAQLMTTYSSSAWLVSMLARRASLYDSLRSGIPACWVPFSQQMINQLRAGQVPPPPPPGSRAANYQALRPELDNLEMLIVRYDVQALLLSEHGSQPEMVRTLRLRLERLASEMSRATFEADVASARDPLHPSRSLKYRDGMFDLLGLPAALPPSGVAPPVPLPLTPR